jgi:hemolysin TlyA family protein
MTRLDIAVFTMGLAESRNRAKTLIETGNIWVNGKQITKPAYECSDSDKIEFYGEPLLYVSRGGYKLAAALDAFDVDVTGCTAADIGASTGGFTDCLLRRGARKVYAVDSGSAQLAEKLRHDNRVVSLEGINARNLTVETLGESCTIVVMDVSFISQTKLYGAASSLLLTGGKFISLIKPQFEVGRGHIGKNGIVKDEKARQAAVEAVKISAEQAGFECKGVIVSPITGGDGNIEYLAYFIKI